MWTEQVPLLHLQFLQSYAPLQISLFKLHPLNNSETLCDIFLKLGTHIKQHQMMYRDKVP